MNAVTPLDIFSTIRAQSAEAVISQSGLNHPGLAAELRRRLASTDPAEGGLLQEPVIEAAPGYVEHAETMEDLAGSLLHHDTVAALDGEGDDQPNRYRFKREWHPYTHQVEAWRKLAEPGVANSVLVTSGTGSGKTECFLVPIIDDLVRQSRHKPIDDGVQAIVLYPLNALIASQEERLRDWTAPFSGRLRFALYNGLLPNEIKSVDARRRPETVADRRSLREAPPPILVTNVTMLEYMLLRPEDGPILAKSQGRLRYIVLDEAHSYVGARAAEIALLLRRVCLAFGVEPGDVRFVATSATIGGPDSEADLARFLADVSGAKADRVSVIRGKACWPELLGSTSKLPLDAALLAHGDEVLAFNALAASAALRTLLDRLRTGAEAIAWSETTAAATKVGLSPTALATAMSRARKDGQALAPLRIHGFHRSVPGLWSCIDPGCKGTRPRDWPFGAVSATDSEECAACQKPTFEVVVCNSCGEPYLDVLERDGGRLVRPSRARPDDEFAAEAEAVGETEQSPDEAEETPAGDNWIGAGDRKLLPWRTIPGDRPLHVDLSEVRACDSASAERTTFRSYRREKPDRCIACNSHGRPGSAELIRSFRFGAPFLLSNLVPNLLEGAAAPDAQAGCERAPPPLGGRQLLSFTDSRQGTARLAAKLQISAERNFVRSFVYHAVQDASSRVPDTTAIDVEIAALESVGAPTLAGLIADKKRGRVALLANAETGLRWPEIVQRLAEREEVQTWLKDLWEPRDPLRFNNPGTLARFLLLREFARRPRRANSLETMGLARLRFEAVDAARTPKTFVDLGGTDEDWRAFLDTILTHLVRANSAVRMSWDDKRWIQPKASLTNYVKAAGVELVAHQRRWPSISQGTAAMTRLARPVLMLVKAFGLDATDPVVKANVQDCLDAAWSALTPVLTLPGAINYALDFDSASIAPIRQAHFCPVTRRILDVSFRGLTPYGVDGVSSPARKTEPVDLPRHPAPFLGATAGRDPTSARSEIGEWLAADPAIRSLRELGVWSDLNDRTALFADFFRSAEHSAQQAPDRLRRYEASFKRGDINVLNCSTTMEMGVDIGSVSHVMMTNVPPSIASYRQRVGRAGRRKQAMSLAFTFCKDRPLDRLAFLDPIRFLGRQMRAPRVALDSAIIVQRHVNALLFSAFATSQRVNALKMQAGAFFGCPSGAGVAEDEQNPASQFIDFLTLDSTRADLRMRIQTLTRGSALDNDATVLDDAIDEMGSVHDAFAEEWRALQASRSRGEPSDTAANRGLAMQLRRMCEDYLLRVLSERGFLPSHGFPTGVVSFVCKIDEPEAVAVDGGRPRLKAYPQRQLDVAMREYAPGAEVVLDGLVHRSAGVTLNWRRPATEEGLRDIQNLLWRWRCQSCGESGTTRNRDSDGSCVNCGAAGLRWVEYLQPAGFAADLRLDLHADPDEVSFVPADEPAIGLRGAPWTALANPDQGRRRENRSGTVFYCNAGPSRSGYEICLHCGRAQPESGRRAEDDGTWLHSPLLGKPDADNHCPGSRKPFGIKRKLRLGYEINTDVFEIQPTGLATRGAALAMAVALREALAQRLGIGFDEMGIASASRSEFVGGRISAFVFDKAVGGSGFSTQAGPLFNELLEPIASILDCKVLGCVAGCPACVLASDIVEEEAASLDRQGALEVVRVLVANGSPKPADAAAPGARLTSDVLDALVRARTMEAKRLVLRLASPLDVASLAGWRAANLVRRWSDIGRQAVISVPPGTVDAMNATALLALRDWLQAWGASLEEAPDAIMPNGAKILAEVIGGERTTALATRDETIFAATALWGRSQVAPIVQFASATQLLKGTEIPLSRLQPQAGAKILTITKELDGPLRSFAKRMVDLLRTTLGMTKARWSPVIAISYSDRYLNSPLTARLAIETLALLSGSSSSHSIPVVMELRALRLDERSPWRFTDDWSRDSDRTAVMTQFAARMGLHLMVKVGSPPHGRSIGLEFQDGRKAYIILDQGFGAWSTTAAPKFVFSESSAAQLKALVAADFRIVAKGATYVVAHEVVAGQG